jgi:hypothetical protein
MNLTKRDKMKDELQNALDKMSEIYLKHIPNGYSNMQVRQFIGVFGSVSVGMIKELDDCPNRIRDNDKAKGHYTLYLRNGEYSIEKNSHTISEVARLKYCAMHLEKVPFRKIVDKDLNKLLAKWEKHISKFKDQLKGIIAENKIYQQNNVKEIYLKLD